MGVDLGKGDERREATHEGPVVVPPEEPERAVARTTSPPAPYRPREPSAEPERQACGGGGGAPALKLFGAAWTVGWIVAFANRWWALGVVMLMLSGPVFGFVRHHSGGDGGAARARRRERHRVRRAARTAPGSPGSPDSVPAAEPAAPLDSVSTAERQLAAAVVRAETAGTSIDPESVALVREVDRLLRPLLAQLRTRDADPQVRHDLQTLAGSHLPRTIDDYLVLPDDYAHEHRTPTRTTPADELRNQLQLLVEGCRQLREAVLAADVDRQQQQSRFLEAKFRRSDLDL